MTGPVGGFLKDEARRRRGVLAMTAGSAAAAAAAATLLLGLSGWFLAGAALAGAAGPVAVRGFNYLLPSAGFRLFAIARTGGRYGERLFGHAAAIGALAALRPVLYGGLAAAPPERSLALTSGEASARLVQDVDAVETAFVRRSAPWAAVAAAAAAAAMVALASPWAAAVLLAGLALQIGLGGRLAHRWTAKPAAAALVAAGELKDSLGAYLAATPELRVFDLAERAGAALMRRDAALGGAIVQRARAEARLALVEAVPPALTLAAIAMLCAGAPPPTAALGVLAALAGLEGTAALLRSAEQAGGYHAALARLDALVASPAPAAPSLPGEIVLDGRRLAPGDRVAVTGPSGAGKTRTLEILVGLRAAPPGRCRIGGVALETAAVGAARALFAYAPQDARLITGSVAENLRLAAPSADDTELWAALEDAQLAGRVRRMPLGLATWIGDGGETLSGGERKRLSLARAYLRTAPWLLLDEPTEGLDAGAERDVVDALARRLDRTGQGALIVSHRPAPLRLCGSALDVTGSR